MSLSDPDEGFQMIMCWSVTLFLFCARVLEKKVSRWLFFIVLLEPHNTAPGFKGFCFKFCFDPELFISMMCRLWDFTCPVKVFLFVKIFPARILSVYLFFNFS